MQFNGIQQTKIRKYARRILFLFVMSWVNMIVQVPVHAAMMQPLSSADHAAMEHCVCPEVLCDTVLNLEHQSSGVVHVMLDEAIDFQPAFIVTVADYQPLPLTRMAMKYLNSGFDDHRPPPLNITRILLI